MFVEILNKLIQKQNLSLQETESIFNALMNGELTSVQIGAFLTALATKGEHILEITGAAKVMREKSNQIKPQVEKLIDTCGTGGDKSGTFNISTTVAFVVAAGGVAVAKHGNRSITSKSGSSDLLEALGVKIDLNPGQVEKSIEEIGIGFMFAPLFHPAMKFAMPVRQELKIKTIFNLLGPLTNPANAHCQLLGVYEPSLTEKFAVVLRELGVQKALVVYGDGLDELTLTGKSQVAELSEGQILNYQINPNELGLNLCTLDDLKGGEAQDNAKITRGILSGVIQGTKKEIVLLNAGAAFYTANIVESIQEGIKYANEVIDSGKAMQKLDQLVDFSNR